MLVAPGEPSRLRRQASIAASLSPAIAWISPALHSAKLWRRESPMAVAMARAARSASRASSISPLKP